MEVRRRKKIKIRELLSLLKTIVVIFQPILAVLAPIILPILKKKSIHNIFVVILTFPVPVWAVYSTLVVFLLIYSIIRKLKFSKIKKYTSDIFYDCRFTWEYKNYQPSINSIRQNCPNCKEVLSNNQYTTSNYDDLICLKCNSLYQDIIKKKNREDILILIINKIKTI